MNPKIEKLVKGEPMPRKAEICQTLQAMAEMIYESGEHGGKFVGSEEELREIVSLKHAEDIVKQDQTWRP